jgi:hypothetical protein
MAIQVGRQTNARYWIISDVEDLVNSLMVQKQNGDFHASN